MCAVQAFCRRQNLGEGAIHLPRSKLESGLPQKRELLWEMMAKVRRREISECKSDMKCPPETRKLQTGIIYHKIGGNARGEGGTAMAAGMRLFGCGECQVAGSNAPPISGVTSSVSLAVASSVSFVPASRPELTHFAAPALPTARGAAGTPKAKTELTHCAAPPFPPTPRVVGRGGARERAQFSPQVETELSGLCDDDNGGWKPAVIAVLPRVRTGAPPPLLHICVQFR